MTCTVPPVRFQSRLAELRVRCAARDVFAVFVSLSHSRVQGTNLKTNLRSRREAVAFRAPEKSAVVLGLGRLRHTKCFTGSEETRPTHSAAHLRISRRSRVAQSLGLRSIVPSVNVFVFLSSMTRGRPPRCKILPLMKTLVRLWP